VFRALDTQSKEIAMPTLKLDLSHYYDYAELTAFLDQAAALFPSLCRKISIGKSFQGRDIWLLEITNTASGDFADKPAFYVDAQIHAGEVTGCATVQWLIAHVLNNYGSDESVTRLLDARTIYALPRIAVDAADYYLKTPHAVRSSMRMYPWDEPRPGLTPEDIDGDGHILTMRVRDPNGTWKVSELDPRIMTKRKPDEEGGTYYRMMREGVVNEWNGRGLKIAPPKYGLDMNRQSPFDWQPDSTQGGAGATPLSEPETRAVHDFIVNHPNIGGAQSFHTFSGVILRPYSASNDETFPTPDLEIFKALGQRGTDITGYKNISIYHDFRYETKQFIRGGFLDWMYEHLGVFCFSTELWDIATKAGVEHDPIKWLMYERKPEDEKKLLDWMDANLTVPFFEPWRKFQHPQLGEVEIGGWYNKFVFQNPPAPFLPEVAEKNARFVLAHAATLPLLKMDDFTCDALGGDLHRIRFAARNYGFLSTAISTKAAERKATRPARAVITLGNGVTLESGEREIELGHIEGRSNKLRMNMFNVGDAEDNVKWAEWVVRGRRGATVEVALISQRGGTTRRKVTL
jgi:murein tripeptide amidase MpaA